MSGQRTYPNYPYPWTSVVIEDGKDSKFVTIRSTIHKTKEMRLTHSYSLSFTDGQILSDSDFLRFAHRFA